MQTFQKEQRVKYNYSTVQRESERELLLIRKNVFLGKKGIPGFLEKRSYLQKYAINSDETKSILLLLECSLRIFVWILKFHLENSQE